MVAMEIGKKETISLIITTFAKTKIYFIKNTNLLHSNYPDKIELTGKVQGDKKCYNVRMVHFQ